MQNNKFIQLFILVLMSTCLLGQTADFTEGCAPLTVTFSAPDLSAYAWNFKDGASSDEKNPENVFTVPGTYNVELFEGAGGTLIGTVTITVYPDIKVEIDADNTFGCIPLPVNFSSTITADPAIDITTINWTFGDGKTGDGNAPMTVYEFGSVFDISVALITNIEKCNRTIEFPDVVEAEDLSATIVLPDEIPCTEPSTFPVSLDASEDSRYTYRWNFGNGDTFNGYNPGEVTYDNFGEYTISVITSSPSGCIDTTFEDISVGPAPLVLDAPDIVCVGEPFTIVNRTLMNSFDWRYGDPIERSFDRDLELTFDTPGVQQIRLIASVTPGCNRDTTFEILVEEPLATFSLEPSVFCDETTPLQLVADDSNLASYIWNEEAGGSVFDLPRIDEPRDPLHINVADSIVMELEVESMNGCKNDTTIRFDFQLAEAYYIPDRILGFLTLDVNFSDFSESQHDIVRRYWIYDDGVETDVGAAVTEHVHTYGCGIFYPRLVIEDSAGCIDTSKRVEIVVICPDDPDPPTGFPPIPGDGDPMDGTGIPGERKICIGAELIYDFPDNGLEYHIYGDDHRIYHCWEDTLVPHTYNFPGSFPALVLREFEGIILDSFSIPAIEICGARSEIVYEKNCDDRLSVELTSNSLNADKLEWLYDGNMISEEESFTYTFDEPGTYEIALRATNIDSGCPPDMDVVTVYIPEVKADFEFPDELMCDSEMYPIDASASLDVGASCYKGYKWLFENQRPREVGNPILEHQFKSGLQDVTLVVEDVNGCTDTITKRTTVYGIEPDFNLDSLVCLPYDIDLMDLSSSDTTIVEWEWSIGSTEQNPNYVFDEDDIDPDRPDTISVGLIVKDAIGCTDTLERDLRVIDPNFFVNSQTGSRICLGQSALFNAIDTAGIKDAFDFFWDIDGVRQDTGFQVELFFPEAGDHLVTLNAIHKNGSCIRMVEKEISVLEAPIPGFVSDKDSIDILCYPAQISFTSDPSLNPNVFDFQWQFGEDDFSEIANPTIEFGIGTHEVKQIVINAEGCKDSISRFYTLVGPDGDFSQDKDLICLGEEITFTLMDTASISRFFWNFGDGTEAENINPVSHIYDSQPIGDSTVVTLTLESDETGCDVTVEYPIFISDVDARIEDLGQLCRGELRLVNASEGASSFIWQFSDNTESTDFEPEKVIEEAGTYEVVLIATDGLCEARDSITVVVDEEAGIAVMMPNLFTPNNDSENDLFGPFITNGDEEEIIIRTFKIYNRYGELVYDNNSPDGWNGIFNGGTAPPEVYAYYIEVDISGCSTISKKGNVTLMR